MSESQSEEIDISDDCYFQLHQPKDDSSYYVCREAAVDKSGLWFDAYWLSLLHYRILFHNFEPTRRFYLPIYKADWIKIA